MSARCSARRAPTKAARRSGSPMSAIFRAYIALTEASAAIGPTDLFARLSATPGWEEFVRTRRGSFGIGISWAEPETVQVPAFAGSVTLTESRSVATPPPPPSATSPAASAPAGSAP